MTVRVLFGEHFKFAYMFTKLDGRPRRSVDFGFAFIQTLRKVDAKEKRILKAKKRNF